MLAVAPEGPAARRGAVPRVADLQRRARGEAGRPAAHRRPVRLRDPDRRLPPRAPAGPARVRAARRGRSGVATPWRIAMLRARGQTQRAIELYEEAMRSLSVPHSRMLSIFIGPELLVDAGRRDEARAAIAEGRRARAGGRVAEPARAELVRGGEAGAAAREGSGAGARRARPRRERAPTSAGSPGRPRCSTRSTGSPCCSRATTSRALARLRSAVGGDAGGRPDPRAADRGGLPRRGRVARRQRGRRRSRRRRRARRRPSGRAPTTSSCRRSPTCPRCSRAASTASRARTRSGTSSAAR